MSIYGLMIGGAIYAFVWFVLLIRSPDYRRALHKWLMWEDIFSFGLLKFPRNYFIPAAAFVLWLLVAKYFGLFREN